MERQEARAAELRITPEEARNIASLLLYAISLNTTAGLVSPTQRRWPPRPTGQSSSPPSSSKASP